MTDLSLTAEQRKAVIRLVQVDWPYIDIGNLHDDEEWEELLDSFLAAIAEARSAGEPSDVT